MKRERNIKNLHNLVVILLFVIFFTLVVSFVMEPELYEVAKEYMEKIKGAALSAFNIVLALIGLSVLIIGILEIIKRKAHSLSQPFSNLLLLFSLPIEVTP